MDDAGSDANAGVSSASNVAVAAVHNKSVLTATMTHFEIRGIAVETE
ncbi:hypothetical protein [Haloplanus natans]|nr:hypothetical protein [Haloplanus natans]